MNLPMNHRVLHHVSIRIPTSFPICRGWHSTFETSPQSRPTHPYTHLELYRQPWWRNCDKLNTGYTYRCWNHYRDVKLEVCLVVVHFSSVSERWATREASMSVRWFPPAKFQKLNPHFESKYCDWHDRSFPLYHRFDGISLDLTATPLGYLSSVGNHVNIRSVLCDEKRTCQAVGSLDPFLFLSFRMMAFISIKEKIASGSGFFRTRFDWFVVRQALESGRLYI